MTSKTTRRPGYAPGDAAVGYRGLHTRRRILECAGRLFVAHGYHSTSIDVIAKAVGGSRASIYQYFEDKSDIFRELFRQCEPMVLDHGRRLGRLAPDRDGVRTLHQWLVEWAHLHDQYAMVLLELPGIGTIDGVERTASDQYAAAISAKLRIAGVRGMAPDDAAAVLIRIVHMVNLYRVRGMFDLGSPAHTSASLAIAMQLLLFPDTPDEALETVPAVEFSDIPAPVASQSIDGAVAADDGDRLLAPPVRQHILLTASALFAEHGYYSVSMQEIAAAAQTSRATLYRYFRSKGDVLAALTEQAITAGLGLAEELRALAETGLSEENFRDWLTRYARFQRSNTGTARAWYDGTLAQQLFTHVYTEAVDVFHRATRTLVEQARLPTGVDPTVATAIVHAVFGRLTEFSVSHHPEYTDADTAALILTVLHRAVLPGGFTCPA